MATGPHHWDLLLRARAIDNLCYVIGSCTARFVEDTSVYQAWGHSKLVDPFGQVQVSCEYDETILYYDVDLDYVDQIRAQIPIYSQRRFDIYELKHKL